MPFRMFVILTLILMGAVALAQPSRPTQSLGAFIAPVDAAASSSQTGAGRTPRKLIDGSGWGETFPGSGVYVHTNDVYADGSSMWNGDWNSWLLFDLGKEYRAAGFYVWNYNEKGGWNTRSVKEVEVSSSVDGKRFAPVGIFTLRMAPGIDGDTGQAVAFAAPVRARWFRWQIRSNYRGGENSGLSEVRFANADARAPAPRAFTWKPKYPRPHHPKLARGQRLTGAENVVYPTDAGVIDVTKPPYNARGDGAHDDTAAIQKALDANPARGAIIYLPNGVYLVSDTLRWGGREDQQKDTVLQGQSRAGTVLRLRDRCPGFESLRTPKGVIYTGHAPAQRFGNEVHNLTVDTGEGNPGACGLQFIANNQGGVYDVTVVSGDGRGAVGLDMGYTDEQGPCLTKNVKVVGFDVGIRVATSVASETMEHVAVEHQNRYGVLNGGQPCTIRDLQSLNEVPAVRNAAGFMVLVGAALRGRGAASAQPAIINDAAMMARAIRTSGYGVALQGHAGSSDRELAGPFVAQYLSKPAASLFGGPPTGLGPIVRETPEVPWDPPASWVAPQSFGARADNPDGDASGPLQRAIDSGATTVYLPRGSYRLGKTVTIRGNVRRIVGCKAFLIPVAPLTGQSAPLFRFEEGAQPVVTMEGINTDFSGGPYSFVEHAARRTLVLRRMAINFQAADAYHSTGGGTVFIEDVVGRWFRFNHQSVWARQFNPEGDGTHVLNDGGTAWILGLKTEGGGTLVDTRNGGRTELLGSFSYTVGRIDGSPMFVVDNAEAAFSFAEVCYTGKPFRLIVRETHDGVSRELRREDPAWGGHFTLYRSGGGVRRAEERTGRRAP